MSRRFLHASFRHSAESAISRLLHGPAAAAGRASRLGAAANAAAAASLSNRAAAFSALAAASAASSRNLSTAAAFSSILAAAPIGAITVTASSAIAQSNSDLSDSSRGSSSGAKPRGVIRSGAPGASLLTINSEDDDDGS